MADGGTLPWRVQKIDESRGPAGDYSAVLKPLPDPPDGVSWHKNSDTGEWSLVRSDEDKAKIKYKLAVGDTWHVRAGRVAPTLISVPIDLQKEEQVQHITVDSASDDTTDGKEEGGKEQGEEGEKRPAIEGVHYLVHTIVQTDTFQGLCLRYKIKPHELRRVNRFSGTNLRLAPHNLIIPLGPNGAGLNGGTVREQDRSCPEFKLHALQNEFPTLRQAECRAYLEISDWDLDAALREAAEDDAWERQDEQRRAREEKEKEEKVRAKNKVVNVHIAVPAEAQTSDGDGGLTEPLLRKFELPKVT